MEASKKEKKLIYLLICIFTVVVILIGATYAYFAFNATNNNITGNVGSIDLTLNVTKVDPTGTSDELLIMPFTDLATNLNNKCIDGSGNKLCQVYKITLTNSASGVNTKVKGTVSFANTTIPNLSWLLINGYGSTTYTSANLGDNFNIADSNDTAFVNNYLLTKSSTVDYYIVVWVNSIDELQTDTGSYTGTVKFVDSNGKGVTSAFTS